MRNRASPELRRASASPSRRHQLARFPGASYRRRSLLGRCPTAPGELVQKSAARAGRDGRRGCSAARICDRADLSTAAPLLPLVRREPDPAARMQVAYRLPQVQRSSGICCGCRDDLEGDCPADHAGPWFSLRNGRTRRRRRARRCARYASVLCSHEHYCTSYQCRPVCDRDRCLDWNRAWLRVQVSSFRSRELFVRTPTGTARSATKCRAST
jgi:hypothetical protein